MKVKAGVHLTVQVAVKVIQFQMEQVIQLLVLQVLEEVALGAVVILIQKVILQELLIAQVVV